jgi:transcriptional regulator with XRE-family HTH domain
MDSGKWIRELREERSVKSADIERISQAIADVKGSADFYISHSTLSDIEAGSVPSVHKLFSLAGCLKVPLEELLLAFGIDVDELREYANQSEPGLGFGYQLEVREPGFRPQLNFDTGFENRETCLLRLNPTDLMGLFPPPLHKYLDPSRYRYAVIGTKDDTMGDLIPPRSLVEIDTMQNAVQMSGWTSVRARPIYLVWHDNGHTCCWCQVQGNELTLLPYPLSHQFVRHFKLPREASVVGRVTNSWLPSNLAGTISP